MTVGTGLSQNLFRAFKGSCSSQLLAAFRPGASSCIKLPPFAPVLPTRSISGRPLQGLLSDPSPGLGTSPFSSVGGAELAAIKQLRERTGAPMKDVKGALVASGWELEAAFTELRKRGLAAASKKQSRVASEGLLGVAEHEGRVAVVEVNCETDFVARNDIFRHLVGRVAQAAAQVASNDSHLSLSALEGLQVALDHPKMSGQSSVSEALAEACLLTGENVRVRRAFKMGGPGIVVASYLHTSPEAGLGRIVGLVGLSVEGGEVGSAVQGMGVQLAMQVVASRPLYISKSLVPPEALAGEEDILRSQAAASGKPPATIEKMVGGRVRKFMEEVVLLEQKFIMDDAKKVQAVVNSCSKDVGAKIEVVDMIRIEVGEGIVKLGKDFAAEVAAQVGA